MPETGYSMVKSYRRCPKQYDYKYNQNLQRKKPAPPLIRGTIIHEMLDARAVGGKTRTPSMVLDKYQEKFGQLFRVEREEYGENFLPDIKRIFEGYERTYLEEEFTVEASEELVSTDLTKDIRFLGHLDKRVIDKRGRRWIMDHKTHKTIPDESQRFSDYQILLYLWCYNREHPREKADGIIWDYIRTKAPRIPEILKNGELTQRRDLDTDYATYAREIRKQKLDVRKYQAFLDELKARSAKKFYMRVPLPAPSTAMVESVVKDFRETSMIMHGLKVYPRTMTRDCSWCEYYNLCMAELRGLDHKFIRAADYEVKQISEENSEED